MKLGELLTVCRDDDVYILDRKGKKLVYGTKFANVCKYLWCCRVLDISTRGLNHLYITLNYLEGNNEEKSD